MSKKKLFLIASVLILSLLSFQIYSLVNYDYFKAEGGVRIEAEISPLDFTKRYARKSLDFDYVMKDLIQKHKENGGDFLTLLSESNQKRLKKPLVQLLNYKEISELSINSSDAEVIAFLRAQLEMELSTAANFYEKRVKLLLNKSSVVDFDKEGLIMKINIVGEEKEIDPEILKFRKIQMGFYECVPLGNLLSVWHTACMVSNPEEEIDENLELIDTSSVQTLSNTVSWKQNGFAIVKDEDKSFVESTLASSDISALFPKSFEFRWSQKMELDDGSNAWQLFAVKLPRDGEPKISEKDVMSAKLEVDEISGQESLTIAMSQEGAEKWAVMTEENIGRLIAMCVDKTVYSAPIVAAAIPNGMTQITGNDHEEMQEIEEFLNVRELDITPINWKASVVKPNPPVFNAFLQKILIAISALLFLFCSFRFFQATRTS